MFRRTAPLALATAILAAAGCSPGDSDTTSEDLPEPSGTPAAEAGQAAPMAASADVEAIDALREDWVTHYNLHHPDMVADLYTSDAWVLAADQGVHEGREAIAAWLESTMVGEPEATVGTLETRVVGDHAVMLGTYRIEGTSPEGEALAFSGHYLNALAREDGEWRIAGSITNYDAPRPEDWTWNEMGGDEGPPPEEGMMTELVEAYETHWNLQHPEMLADLYTDDARAAFRDGPLLEGRTAIAARMREVLTEPGFLDVHDVGTVELDENHRLDGGWYELSASEGGEIVQSGMYVNLVERRDDGSWAIRWMVTNGRSMPGSG